MAENPARPLASIFLDDYRQCDNTYVGKPYGLSGGDDDAQG